MPKNNKKKRKTKGPLKGPEENLKVNTPKNENTPWEKLISRENLEN